jgi:predicted CopG family antitoxin
MARIRLVKSISITENSWQELKRIAKANKRSTGNMVEVLIEMYKKKGV